MAEEEVEAVAWVHAALKVASAEVADGLDVKSEVKRGINNNLQGFELESQYTAGPRYQRVSYLQIQPTMDQIPADAEAVETTGHCISISHKELDCRGSLVSPLPAIITY